MTLGLALLVIFILFLIDKHGLWRTTGKIAAGFLTLILLSVAVWQFISWRKNVRDDAVIDCVSRLNKSWYQIPLPEGTLGWKIAPPTDEDQEYWQRACRANPDTKNARGGK